MKSVCTCTTSIVFTPVIRRKDGKILVAAKYGKKAFPIVVKSKDCFSCKVKSAKQKQSQKKM